MQHYLLPVRLLNGVIRKAIQGSTYGYGKTYCGWNERWLSFQVPDVISLSIMLWKKSPALSSSSPVQGTRFNSCLPFQSLVHVCPHLASIVCSWLHSGWCCIAVPRLALGAGPQADARTSWLLWRENLQTHKASVCYQVRERWEREREPQRASLGLDYVISGLGRTRHFLKLTNQLPNLLRASDGSSPSQSLS